MGKSVPDWRNPTDYRHLEDVSLHHLAWEFLRRNPVFQHEMSEAAKWDSGFDMVSLMTPPHRPCEWDQKPTGACLQKWGIRVPVLPEVREFLHSLPPMVFEEFPRTPSITEWKDSQGLWRHFHYTETREDRCVMEFDLTAPIGPQIQRAKERLKTGQEIYGERGKPVVRQGRKEKRVYPYYLRVLDAMLERVTDGAMVEVFSMETDPTAAKAGLDTIRNWREAAVELRDGGYRELLSK